MPITDLTSRLSLSAIHIERDSRQRKIIDVGDLLPSIKLRGVINPIIVETRGEEVWLVAGERRLEACRQLGLPSILVRFTSNMSQLELQIIELEENLKRQDLGWKDQVDAIQRIHTLYSSLDSDWTMTQTAENLGLSLGNVSMNLKVAENISDPKIITASTTREAFNTLSRREQRAAGSALEQLISDVSDIIPGPTTFSSSEEKKEPPAESILNQSFLEWAPSYSGPKFNFLHCDFPFGVNVFAGPQGRGAERTEGYSDEKDVYFTLLESFCTHLDKFTSLSAHLMFWFSFKYYSETKIMFSQLAPSLEFFPHLLIWGKSDNAGITPDANRLPRHTYETALLARRGDRKLVQAKADHYSAPTDRTLHPSTKPEPVLRHFFSMLVDENTTLFDPTCGSGSALRAGESLGASKVFGLEIDAEHAKVARIALANSRSLSKI